ncbi:MAG TPA: hypothetical protein VLA14_07680 [Polyangia bacterium]|jgi:hypothetical protein|nr:hypothetical protein [Polyangia bacterium]
MNINTTSLTKIARRMPKQLRNVRSSLKDVQHQALRATRQSPGRSILGAFAIGFVFAKLARIV